MFDPGSRYANVPDAVHVGADGVAVPYKLLRPIPAAPTLFEHVVAQGDRLDLLAFRLYGDPEQFWRLCDANRALDPADLVAEPGRRLVVPAGLG
jgi:nucleoid-associated protein YgaU